MITYKQSGVDINANARWVDAIQSAMRGTYGPRVPAQRPGGFAGLFRLDYDEGLFRRNYKKPMLVACADGVGTKLLLAISMKRLNTIGIDLVAMNVNDLATCGAEPLFFLDYLAVSRLDPQGLLEVIEGIAEGCRQAGCALLGGETAEMPGLYAEGELDLAGFAVGVAEHGRVIDGSRISPGDVLIGLPSSGIHSNGYTLVRRLITQGRFRLDDPWQESGQTLGEVLLRPTRIYTGAVRAVLRAYPVKRVVTGMAHITGGGLRENICRLLPERCDAVVNRGAWKAPAVFDFLQRLGTSRTEMFKVFNMGVGYVFIVRPAYAVGVSRVLERAAESPFEMGHIDRGRGRLLLR